MTGIKFKTKLWKQSQNSYGSTIPKALLAARGVNPEENDVKLVWEINNKGEIQVTFKTTENND